MAEKRKPCYTLLLRMLGKKKCNKVEIFSGSNWGQSRNVYRLRVNGKWHRNKEGAIPFFYKTEIRHMVFASIRI